jgi:hypothetical protein
MKLITHTLAALLGALGAVLGVLAWDAAEERRRRHYFKVTR